MDRRTITRMKNEVLHIRKHADNLESKLDRLAEEPEAFDDRRFVNVSYIKGDRLARERWDYIDGIGNLKLGDRVFADTIYGTETAIVTGHGKAQERDWKGPWRTIRQRA